MPKKKRSEGKDKIIPANVSENHTWKCPQCGTKGKAYTKKDARIALELHKAFAH